jgi:hypothetical protein
LGCQKKDEKYSLFICRGNNDFFLLD